ncbi:hypothetical protein CC78DRAFT_569347 [Lojkania enalia]|uniref:DUF7703 domain-containing protein n=1 Tax=Lojkania enalia TaxID=147567 RepID=A0A9P4N254_9PLEO|nr:hypothetical protein CC78DRAFT_569347 [Didymosphaeria enalia]
MYEDCQSFVPFSHYDWTFERLGPPKWNPAAYCLIASFFAVAYWMSIELLVLVYVTFKRRTGIYFWSIIITTLGVILQTTGYIMKEYARDVPIVLTTIICKVGWVSNVTGFSIVLWSRLHLVVGNPQILRGVLAMIIINGIALHTPVVVFEFGLISRHKDKYIHPMEVIERVQQTVFSLQETIIGAIYIYHTAQFLNSGYPTRTRTVVRLLVGVQALVIGFDAGLTVFDYKNMLTLKCSIHPFVYALKLKLEFIVLNQLVGVLKKGLAPGAMDLLKSGSSSSLEERPASASRDARSGDKRVKVAGTFIAKPELVGRMTTSSSAVSSVEPGMDNVTVSPARATATAMAREEGDLIDVIGRPDNTLVQTRTVITDVERQYLGRFSG